MHLLMGNDLTEIHPHLEALGGYSVQPTLYVLTREQCLIGRGASNTIQVERDGVSRQHAMIARQDDAFQIIDLRSSWGTYVNGERIAPLEPYHLPADALIGLGSPKPLLRFYDPDPTRPPPDLADAREPILKHDAARQCFVLHGRVLELPFLAYQLLAYLYQNYGAICRASSCIHAVWEIDKTNADELADRLYRLMSELRLALEAHQTQIDLSRRVHIESHRRRGYTLVVPEEPVVD